MNLWERMENPIPIGDLPDDNKMFRRDNLTLTERVIRFLTEGLRKRELKSSGRKYRKFEGSKPGNFYFVGKAGALRAGKTSSDSVSLTEHFHSNMKLWERKKGLQLQQIQTNRHFQRPG